MSVERCPVCCGTGNVCGGFYSSCPGGTPVSTKSMEICRACNGRGVFEYYEQNTYYEEQGDKEDSITVLKDIKTYLVMIIEELQKLGRNV